LTVVVDLGSGTGLSTRSWADAAERVIGVEPNAAMRAFAERATIESNVRYVRGSGEATGLPDGVADLVTTSQSLQWMDPEAALPEIARILRPGGVLCAYEYASLQTPLWEPEAVWDELRARVRRLREERGLNADAKIWPVSRESLDASGLFGFVRETAVHSRETGDGERLVALALSEGSLTTLLASGVTEADVGLDRLRAVSSLMKEPIPWWFGYRVWLARRQSETVVE
jgi:SAM-dependent methyltransferase